MSLRPLMNRHLTRLAIASGVSILAGAGLYVLFPSFATMTIGWAMVNLIICFFGRKGPEPELAKTREFLMLNMGLNVAYMSVGVTMMILGFYNVKLSGLAIIIQGLILFVLDGWLIRELMPTQKS